MDNGMTDSLPLQMHPHHAATLARVVEHFQQDPEVLALILGGSLAHGFAQAASDVDVMIVVSESDYERRRGSGHTQYFTKELATYDAGYIDGKYVTPQFIQQVADRGSEPARYA